MQLKPQQLAGALQKTLAPVYLLCGEEPQQLGELADLIRQSAKNRGFSSREVFFVDKNFDWNQFSAATDNLSIFADQKIIDLKLSALPSQDGAKILTAYCQHLPADTLLLISAGKIAKTAQKGWFQAIDKIGCIIQVWPLTGSDLLRWIQNRLQQRGLLVEPEAVKMLADRVEGNLLAAAQEVEKLYVFYGAGKLNTAQINDVVADSSRYDVFKLVDAALSRQPAKFIKIASSLKTEGIAPTLALWALARETRLLIHYKTSSSPAEKDQVLRKNAVWGERKQLIDASARKLGHNELNKALRLAAKTDRQIKGQQQGDPWETLLALGLTLMATPMLDSFSNTPSLR